MPEISSFSACSLFIVLWSGNLTNAPSGSGAAGANGDGMSDDGGAVEHPARPSRKIPSPCIAPRFPREGL